MSHPAFANILLSGPCNLRCPDCIGRQLPRRGPNLDRYPLPGLERFVALLRASGVRQVSLTGTDTDPLLYRHPRALLAALRAALPGVQVSLHTNGVLALRAQAVVNLFDRATISLPSLRPDTCLAMTGRARPLDLERLVAAVRIPLKISVLVTQRNRAEVPALLARCAALGLRRVVLRTPVGATHAVAPPAGARLVRCFGGNPVYACGPLEVTVWDFARSQLGCLNLYSDGSISSDYLLCPAPRTGAVGGVEHAA